MLYPTVILLSCVLSKKEYRGREKGGDKKGMKKGIVGRGNGGVGREKGEREE